MVNRPATLLLLLLPVGCSDNGFTQLAQEDVFQQNRLNTVDILLVVDNSCSMVEEQQKLATNFDSFIHYFVEANVDWQLGVVTTDVFSDDQSGRLIGGDDEIILANAEGGVEDEVAYGLEWPIGPGVVFSLDPSWASTVKNDTLSHWCTTVEATPGEANPGCGGDGPGIDDRLGGLLITEFVADPDVLADDQGEWLEITNISAEDADLSAYTLSDGGRNLYTIPDGTLLPAGASLVLARSLEVEGADLAMGADFTLNNHDLFLNQDTEGPSEIFAEMVAQGISGSGLEMGLEAARLAVTEPLLSGANVGFVRAEANFSILVVSDEEDSSPDPVSQYLRDFADLKGEAAYRDHTLMNVSAVVGDAPPPFEGDPSCSSSSGLADYGHRYVDAVSQTAGLLDSICDEDFSPIVDKLGLTLSGLEADFQLSRVPVLESLKVALYADASDESHERDLVIDVDFSYSEATNEIQFAFDQVPESQQYILVEYTVRSGS